MEIKAEDTNEEQAKKVLLKELNQVADDYKNEQIKYNEASEMFDNLKKYRIIREELEQAIAETSSLHDSREAFKLAKEYTKNIDWASALANLIRSFNFFLSIRRLIVPILFVQIFI